MITLNRREQLPWHEGLTVQDLLEQEKFTYPHIVVSINGTVVNHDAYAETLIPDDADVRVIHLIAGG
ncbi:MAG TPA: sulfur carrier protein ThiS [Anaerolineae bacterium]|nr:sulfur carrier protein ThiS [Anaerolineae bacterium]HPD40069.1 sulfur carrier protein ThiS [Anaerolineae bacterium]HRT31314.1 sulfur carrier protein ThiS [Anaerolineae bacterium]HRU94633.1 sulfur carrier protein ThiS [Anaerolineae bacterium]HXK41235.1 sulfur carrier protein ThiS [Anaerolineae bacterium]